MNATVRLALLSGLMLMPAFASAQDRPQVTPTRDVEVTYRVSGGPDQAGPADVRLSWLKAERKLRMDIPGGIGWSLLDQRAERVVMVMDQLRMVAEVPVQAGLAGPSPLAAMLPHARFTRGAGARVAGQPCTIWRYQEGGNQGQACITADGVVLRGQGTHGGRSGSVEATRVDYGPQDPARFRLPAGYRTMPMPAGLLPGAGRPPGR